MARTILVVDDDDAVRDFLRHALASGGYRVDVATHGHEALARLAGGGIDLVLLDIMMPIMDGWETLAHLRALPRAPPVLVMSASLEEDRALGAGAAGTLAKPFSVAELLAACLGALDRRAVER